MAFCFLFLLSFAIVAFGQPAWSSILSTLTAIGGYGLFWWGVRKIDSSRRRFWLAWLWFTLVQLVQLSWMSAYDYVGPYILVLYLLLSAAMGGQFAIVTALLPSKEKKLTFVSILAICSLWTLFEWSRLFVICGFSWNPAGLSLASTLYGAQGLSLLGIFGLTFWVFLVNLLGVRALENKRGAPAWLFAAALPFLYGWGQVAYHEHKLEKSPKLSVVLVQTALLPEERMVLSKELKERALPPLEQWSRIFQYLKKFEGQKIDLLVLPEGVVPYGTYLPIFTHSSIEHLFHQAFGEEGMKALPGSASPLAMWEEASNADEEALCVVGNGYCAQALANYFQAEVVAGLEDFEFEGEKVVKSYQAAFHFLPGKESHSRYEKQILVPVAEYLPFEGLKELAASWGIIYFYTPGKESKVFSGKVPLGVNICYEETFGHLMRQNKEKGAKLLVNVTNDVWYPNTTLPKQHFDLGRLRTIENGIPLVRACNTGVTSAIDSLGRTLAIFGEGKEQPAWIAGALHVHLPLYTYSTLYTRVGDWLIVTLCFLFLGSIGFGLLKSSLRGNLD